MKIIKLFYILLLVINVFTLFVGIGFFFPVHAAETTYYLGSTERTFNDNGTLVSEKVYIGAGNATVLKQCNNGAMKQCASPTTSYLYADHLGSTVLITDDKGTKETTLQYYPYGSISNQQSAIGQLNSDKLYTSQRLDFSSDLYFYNARYYNPTTGNFISADKAQGPNRYAYVGNNPIMRNDPSGNISTNGIKIPYMDEGLKNINPINLFNNIDKKIYGAAINTHEMIRDVTEIKKNTNLYCGDNKKCVGELVDSSISYHLLAIGADMTGEYPMASKFMNKFLDKNNNGNYQLTDDESNNIANYIKENSNTLMLLSFIEKQNIDLDSLEIGQTITENVENLNIVINGSNDKDLWKSMGKFTIYYSGNIALSKTDDGYSVEYNGNINKIYDVYDFHSGDFSEDKIGIDLQKAGIAKPFTIFSNPSWSYPYINKNKVNK